MGLSKEEKKALKLEKARLAVELVKTRKREQLERELTAYELHRQELQTKMHTMMATAKKPVYRQTINVMCKVFDRTLDKKDHLINLIMHLRRIAENQYQSTISAFCVVVDGIITTFKSDLEDMCKETDKKIGALIFQGQEETNYIIEYQKSGETHLNILLYHSHELADNLAWTIRGDNFVKLDEDTNKYLEIRDELRATLEGLYSSTWDEFKGTLKGYVSGTSENQKQVRVLRKKEAMMSDIIASQARQIAASEGIIRRLRSELICYESGAKQAGFRDRRKRHKDACNQLKKCFTQSLEIDEKQLDRLVMVSNDSTTYLEHACKKGEKILHIAALCRKLETQYEKVFPFGAMQDLVEIDSKSIKRRKYLSEDSLVANALSTTCGMTRLWQRTAKVELSKRALLREKSLLEQENAELVRILNKRNDEKLYPKAIKCTCVSTRAKISLVRPHAVEGSLEVRKFIR